MNAKLLFPNYTQIDAYLPVWVWQILRYGSIAISWALVYFLVFDPKPALDLFWNFAVILLPFVFFVIPGLWRNLCPLAAMNQLPRYFGWTLGWTLPEQLKGSVYSIGFCLFFFFVLGRKVFFNTSGLDTACLVAGALLAALLGGFLFKGKSGWCSTICPILPVQRLYGQNPYLLVANSHCQPCVGCVKNCYDFNPTMAPLADQYDDDRHYVGFRRLFAALFPGFILAYFMVPSYPVVDLTTLMTQTALYMSASLALFTVLDLYLAASLNSIITVYAAAALSIYYGFASVKFIANLQAYGIPVATETCWWVRGAVLLIAAVWVARTWRTEKAFLRHMTGELTTVQVKVSETAAQTLSKGAHSAAELRIEPEGKRITPKPKQSILEAVETCGLKLESGCRMGVCGADPVAITSGMEALSPMSSDEKSTLQRLGFAENTRMACCARIQGNVSVELKPHARTSKAPAEAIPFDPAIKQVVIVGTGIAGVTAADYIRRHHPECEIHLIGKETHLLYNRMGIGRLIYGQSGMQGLYLMPESWYKDNRITLWVNTLATKLDVTGQTVKLATGESLPYDRLILATGSSSSVPPLEGVNAKGSFVLREADDAMAIRNYVQSTNASSAIISGAGLLGLELAYALKKLGLSVKVLSNSARILNRQLDEAASTMLTQYLSGLGIEILTQTQAAKVEAQDGRIKAVHLQDGQILATDLFLVCIGVRPNLELARSGALEIKKGIVVNDKLQTSVPHVYAVGDCAEFQSEMWGLWAVAVEQAEIAALNALGSTPRTYQGFIPSTLLKVVGADVMSVGQFEATGTDEVIAEQYPQDRKYRKLVIRDGKLIGAILIGYPSDMAVLTKAVKNKQDVSSLLSELRRGNFHALTALIEQAG